jgi:hypothetical protein
LYLKASFKRLRGVGRRKKKKKEEASSLAKEAPLPVSAAASTASAQEGRK